MAKLHGEASVEHVGAGEPEMDETGVGADELCEMSEEGDDIVLGHPLDLIDLRHVELGCCPFPDCSPPVRDHADLRHCF